MIKKLIDDNQYEEALKFLEGKMDEESLYYKLVCLYGLGKYDEVIEIGDFALKNASKLYYDIISLYISALVDLEKDEEALTLLEQELLMPYIPYKYAEQFNTTYDYLIKKRTQNSKQTSMFSHFTNEELSTILLSGDNNDVVIPIIIELRSRNIRLFLDVIKFYLKDVSKPRFIKVLLIESLVMQQIDEEIEFITKDEHISINPSELSEIVPDSIYSQFEEIFDNPLLSKNPTLYEYCLDVLPGYLGLVYPLKLDENEIPLIAAGIHLYVCEICDIDIRVNELGQVYGVNEDKIRDMASFIAENLYEY
ncbi:TPA: DUF3196 family protein [bacterium]|nr:DUF3196 family protein [bacterium]